MGKETTAIASEAMPTTPEEFKTAFLKQSDTYEGRIKSLSVGFDTQLKELSDKNVELINKNGELEAKCTRLLNQLTECETIITELQDELANKEVNTLTPNTTPTLKHKGKVYEVHARKFKFEGNSYVISDLQDKELVGRLIEKNAGFLVPVA